MSALEVIRRVEALGGRVLLDEGRIRLRAPTPLPDDIVAAVSKEKASIMVALGAPLDTVVSGVIEEMRPHLPDALRHLPDSKLLVLVNWAIINSFETAIRKGQPGAR